MGFDLRPRVKRAFRLALRRPDLTEAEVDEELRFHIASRIDQLVSRGLTREQAADEARRRFGISWDDAVARVHAAGQARERRLGLVERVDAARRDLAYAARTLSRQPIFSLVVVLTFALGIGANATMFGVIDRLLLRPPPHVGRAAELFQVGHFARFLGEEELWTTFPYPFYTALRADSATFSSVGAAGGARSLTLGSGSSAARIVGAIATAEYFRVLQTTPALGRFFTSAETGEASAADVAVVSYGFWQRHFAGDPAALGKALRIDSRVYTVIGVAREEFTGVDPHRVDVWVPPHVTAFSGLHRSTWRTEWDGGWLEVYVRLRPGVTIASAVERASASYVAGMQAWSGKVVPKNERTKFVVSSVLPSARSADSRESRVTTLLLAVSAVVLLIACANIASLLLARGAERRREIAVRLALGVSRARLVRLLVAETVLLALCGGVVAVVVAHWGLALLHTTLLADFAWTSSVLDGRMLAATAAMILTTAALAGLAPAWRSSRPDVVASLTAGGRAGSVSTSRIRTGLIVVQAALSVVLLVGAGLFARSLREAASVHLGYERDRVVAAGVDLVPLGRTLAERFALYAAMRDRVASLPGVESAAFAFAHPLEGRGLHANVRVPGRDSLPLAPMAGPQLNGVAGDYFRTLGLPMVDGRPITSADVSARAPVAVLSAAMARAYWPGERAVGRCLMIGDEPVCTTVVGVASDAFEWVEESTRRFVIYRPISDRMEPGANTIIVRSAGKDPRKLVEPIRRAIQGTAPDLPYASVYTMDDAVGGQVETWRMGAVLFSVFGGLALLIASVGLYSAISYAVTQRRHEFGVRMALGAQIGDVLRLVMQQGLRAAVGGLVLGFVAAVLAGTLVADLLFRTSPRNPTVFVAVGAIILVVAVAATFVPAWRASRTDPATALRAD
ncbi:MAG TPA: ABC transporter permease [Gemmatimonadaceae bacterium]|nr:ABC transporter permease [Gemmatimonadaceae bacterium]